MKRHHPSFSALTLNTLIGFSLSLFFGCAFSSKSKMHEDLELSVYMFNKRFEGKMMDLSSAFVPMEEREKFLTDSLRVKDNVVFYDTSILNMEIFDENGAVKLTPDGPEKEFNKAEVVMRYQVAVLPSNKLKTIKVRQKWVRSDEEGWKVIPDLNVFFK